MKINPLNYSTLDDVQIAFLESLKSSSFDEFYNRIIKLKTIRSEQTRMTLKSVMNIVVSFMQNEDVLGGSLFLVCKDWYSVLIDNEQVWNVVFERLIASSIEFGKEWQQSKNTQIHNNFYDVNLGEHSYGSGNISWLTPQKKDYSWQFKKAFCQAKYQSYSKHCKIGTVRPYLVTSVEEDHSSFMSTRDIAPNLSSVFHIVERECSGTNVNDNWMYSVICTPETNYLKSNLSFSMDYFNIALPHQSFTMKVAFDLFNYDEISDRRFICEISVSLLDSLKSFNPPTDNSTLELVKAQESGEEGEEERINMDNIEIFRSEWLGEKGDIPRDWFLSFIASFQISSFLRATTEAIYY